jgi:hypothetical protein
MLVHVTETIQIASVKNNRTAAPIGRPAREILSLLSCCVLSPSFEQKEVLL